MYTTLHDPPTHTEASSRTTSRHTGRRQVPFANWVGDFDRLDAHPETDLVHYYTLGVTTIDSPNRRVSVPHD